MNGQDRDAIAELKLAVTELQKTVELIETNHLPTITAKVDVVEGKTDNALGKLSVLIPLSIATLTILIGAIIGFVVLT